MRCIMLVIPYQCAPRTADDHKSLTADMSAACRELEWELGEVIAHPKTPEDVRELELLKQGRDYLDAMDTASVLGS